MWITCPRGCHGGEAGPPIALRLRPGDRFAARCRRRRRRKRLTASRLEPPRPIRSGGSRPCDFRMGARPSIDPQAMNDRFAAMAKRRRAGIWRPLEAATVMPLARNPTRSVMLPKFGCPSALLPLAPAGPAASSAECASGRRPGGRRRRTSPSPRLCVEIPSESIATSGRSCFSTLACGPDVVFRGRHRFGSSNASFECPDCR